METGLNIGIELLRNMLVETTFLGSTYIFQITLIIASLAIITRRWQNWGELAFPIALGWQSAGIGISPLLMTFLVVTFGISTLSTKVIGDAFSIAGKGLTQKGRETFKVETLRKSKERMNIQEEMKKIKLEKEDKRTPQEKRESNIRKELYNEALRLALKAKEYPSLLSKEEKKKLKEAKKLITLRNQE